MILSPRSLKERSMAAQEPPRNTPDNHKRSLPYFIQKVRLRSSHAQQLFERGFERCADAIFSLSVVLRFIGTEEQAREAEGIIDERINKTFEDIRAEIARLEKLAEANGIEFAGIDYSNPKDVEAKITSPRAVRFVALIREFDSLVARMDTLWLSGVIPDSNYSLGIYEWKRRLLRLSLAIRTVSAQAMASARRKEKKSDNKNIANQVDNQASIDSIKEDSPVDRENQWVQVL